MTDDFNWVKARHQCSVGELFEALKAEVRTDAEERDQLLRPEQHSFCGFKFRSGNRSFAVWIEGNKLHQSVEFTLEQRGIAVRKNGGDLIFSVTAALDDNGQCVAKIGDKEYQRWQVRKLALDDLFFHLI